MCSSVLSLASVVNCCGWAKPRLQMFYPENDLVPIVQKAVWAPGNVWTGDENFPSDGI